MRHRPVVVVLGGAERPPGMHGAEQRAVVRYTTEDRLADELPGAEVLFVWRTPGSAGSAANIWPNADALRWVHSASAGAGGLPPAELLAGDVLVTSSRGVFDEPIAEYVLGVVLAFAKDLPGRMRLQQSRGWRHLETERVAGKSALVAGTGSIGRAIGRKLRAAGMSVTGVGRAGRANDPDFGVVLPLDRWTDGLRGADYVVLAAALTRETRGLVDRRALITMKPTARVINVGRAGLVVLDELAEAVRVGRIAGAALDVFPDERLPGGSPLWELPSVLLSPHMSGQVVGWRAELVGLFTENLRRYLDGEELINLVDRPHG
ncbi:MAG: D-2-hydroxyacid dehydrogenase [Labedaea sp.]